VDGTGSVLCPVAGFDISGVEPFEFYYQRLGYITQKKVMKFLMNAICPGSYAMDAFGISGDEPSGYVSRVLARC
jgi:hypothetical protein